MQALDLTLHSPAENLALDEALLLEAEDGHGTEALRFWMSAEPFVVVGIGGRLEKEVYLDRCASRRIPVLRRCSGGGTVVQGPGCLNYSLILRIPEVGPLKTIHGSNRHIMERNATALSQVIHREVTVQGHTDLTIDGCKVSGNAQRRLRRHLLFHGTFLLNANLPLVSELLPTPVLQPDYREHRSHATFLRNLEVDMKAMRNTLMQSWDASPGSTEIPGARVAALVEQRYGRREWNYRR